MLNDIIKVIENNKKNNKTGLMGHIIAGFPDFKTSFEAGISIIESGASILEVQFPFSDPTADGPTIESACYESIKKGFRVEEGFKLIKKLSEKSGAVILLMSYGNIVFKYGVENFIKKAKECGASGLIIPDMPVESDEKINSFCNKYGIADILVVAPGADADRIKMITERGSGFLYTSIRTGITGDKSAIDDEAKKWLSLVKDNSKLPVAAAFGIRTNEQIRALGPFCDIAVVGSYFVNIIRDNYKNKKSVKDALAKSVKELLKITE